METIPVALVAQFNELCGRVARGTLDLSFVRQGLQALIEHRPMPEDPSGSTVITQYEGVEITEAFLAQTMVRDGQKLRRHRNGGGWVPADQDENDEWMPFVAETAYVGPFAMVANRARVMDDAEVHEHALVADSARVGGCAIIAEFAWIMNRASIGESAHIDGTACAGGDIVIGGDTYVGGKSTLAGNFHITDGSWVDVDETDPRLLAQESTQEEEEAKDPDDAIATVSPLFGDTEYDDKEER